MEPKVINRAVVSAANNASNWCYPPRCSFSQQSGSGNNWARGYNSYGPKFANTVCELVRREVKLTFAHVGICKACVLDEITPVQRVQAFWLHARLSKVWTNAG